MKQIQKIDSEQRISCYFDKLELPEDTEKEITSLSQALLKQVYEHPFSLEADNALAAFHQDLKRLIDAQNGPVKQKLATYEAWLGLDKLLKIPKI